MGIFKNNKAKTLLLFSSILLITPIIITSCYSNRSTIESKSSTIKKEELRIIGVVSKRENQKQVIEINFNKNVPKTQRVYDKNKYQLILNNSDSQKQLSIHQVNYDNKKLILVLDDNLEEKVILSFKSDFLNVENIQINNNQNSQKTYNSTSVDLNNQQSDLTLVDIQNSFIDSRSASFNLILRQKDIVNNRKIIITYTPVDDASRINEVRQSDIHKEANTISIRIANLRPNTKYKIRSISYIKNNQEINFDLSDYDNLMFTTLGIDNSTGDNILYPTVFMQGKSPIYEILDTSAKFGLLFPVNVPTNTKQYKVVLLERPNVFAKENDLVINFNNANLIANDNELRVETKEILKPGHQYRIKYVAFNDNNIVDYSKDRTTLSFETTNN